MARFFLRVDEIGVDCQRAAVAGDRLIEVVPIGERIAQVALGRREMGIERERRFVTTGRLVEPPRGAVQIAQAIERGRVLRIKSQRPAIRGFRLGPILEGFQHNPQVGMKHGFARLGLDGLQDEVPPLFRKSAGKGRHSQQVQRIGLPRIRSQDSAVEFFGPVEPAGLMMPQTLF